MSWYIFEMNKSLLSNKGTYLSLEYIDNKVYILIENILFKIQKYPANTQ